LAVVELRDKLANRIARHWMPFFVMVSFSACAYLVIAIAAPTWLDWVPFPSKPFVYAIALLACACYAFAGWRSLQAYRMALLPLQGAMALSMVFLVESQLFLLGGSLGRLSWWEYHVVMLIGFFSASCALLWQFRATGDLGVIVEGLFLRERISGMRQNDPRALPALIAAVSAKDNETSNHIERVSELSVAIGRHMGLAENRLELLRLAGRLHDVGKIGVPNAILRKPGKLTPAEYAEMKQHSNRGWLIATRSPALVDVASIIRAHHERMDGSGYPDGLIGEGIPLESRIVSVADYWDALTGSRPYRGPMPTDEAAALTRESAGSHLDPHCVDALFAVVLNQQPSSNATSGWPELRKAS
jgi:HD-GYP domain-containing protein (c-di-GMP phosphodiesterase class II)